MLSLRERPSEDSLLPILVDGENGQELKKAESSDIVEENSSDEGFDETRDDGQKSEHDDIESCDERSENTGGGEFLQGE